MAPPPPIIDPTQPLPRLTLDQPWMAARPPHPGLLSGRLTLDPWVQDTLGGLRSANLRVGTVQTFPRAFLDEIEKSFNPKKHANVMGCMGACYGVLAILYTEPVSKEIEVEVRSRAYAKAREWAKDNPDKLKARMAELQAANPMLLDTQARQKVMDSLASPHITSDHTYRLMGERGLAEAVVKSPDAKAEEAIRGMTGDAPGLFFFGLAVNDNHTVTLAVERAADGSQRMYWLDQNNRGLSHEIKAGELGSTLQSVPGHTTSTNIYAFRPPAGQ
jgi:hypothetical protein